jgi:hypothetical protein
MNIRYKKLFELVLRHDYLLLQLTEDETNPDPVRVSEWPQDYDIRLLVSLVPTPATRHLMEQSNMVFRATAKGGEVWVRATDSVQSPGEDQSYVLLSEDLRLDFTLQLVHPHFYNFTNLRLEAPADYLYYFDNRVDNSIDITTTFDGDTTSRTYRFLSRPLVAYPNLLLSTDARYQLGDIVWDTADQRMLEALGPQPPSGPNPSNVTTQSPVFWEEGTLSEEWQELPVDDARYVTAADRYPWRSGSWLYTRQNTNPGEWLTFELQDIAGVVIDLGNVPGTDRPQSRFRTSLSADEDIAHRIDLGGLPAGQYHLLVNGSASGALLDEAFCLLDRQQYRSAFALVSCFADSPEPDNRFVERLPATGSNDAESLIVERQFEIRFKNRSTRWRYRRDGGGEYEAPSCGSLRPLLPLSRQHPGTINYTCGGGGTLDALLPAPDTALIKPERDTNQEIASIYSDIYLNEQY